MCNISFSSCLLGEEETVYGRRRTEEEELKKRQDGEWRERERYLIGMGNKQVDEKNVKEKIK